METAVPYADRMRKGIALKKKSLNAKEHCCY
jgi:hypothetical protein